ncbi:ComEC/Rec2 family competence protein [Aureimonas frigidaquae]|nr:ComEC/Rec2 family competence protein [Aureimonas frigidaquae]
MVDRISIAGTRPILHSCIGWLRLQMDAQAARRTGLHAITLALILGIAAYHLLSWRISMRSALAAMAMLLALIAALRRRPVLAAGPIVFGCLLLAAALAGQVLAQWEMRGEAAVILSGTAMVRIEGRVVERQADDLGRWRYRVRISRTFEPTLSRPPSEVRITVASAHEPIPIGGSYRGLVRLSPPSGPAYPTAYDFAVAAYFGGLGAYGFALGPPDAVPDTVGLQGVWEHLAAFRSRITERIHDVITGPAGAVAAALVTGDRDAIPDQISKDFRVTGLSHVLSISGYHMALVAGFVMGSVRLLLALLPWPSRWPAPRKVAAAFALVWVLAYLAIASPNVATERSFIMIVLMLGAVLLDRPALTLRNVSLAAMIVLALAPHEALSASFQLSFAATAALVGVASHLLAGFGKTEGEGLSVGRLGALILVAIVSSAVAGLSTTPFVAYHFGRTAPYGVVTNILVMPLFSFWVMPAGLVAMLAMPFGLDAPFLILMGWGLDAVFVVTRHAAALLPDRAAGLMSGQELITYAAALFCACFLVGALRWLAVPLTLLALALSTTRPPLPDMLLYEDGRKLAIVKAEGLRPMGRPPGPFIANQWTSAFGPFLEDEFVCADSICRASGPQGLRIGWTEDYTLTETLCATSDIAIVARAIRERTCQSGAKLITLRTLRRSGSLAIRDLGAGRSDIRQAIPPAPQAWNLHRLAPWPESLRRKAAAVEPGRDTAEEAVSNGGSSPPDAPAP